ncbi:MAG: helix-turn-helix domain-containing protein [Lawsonibacter sp.]
MSIPERLVEIREKNGYTRKRLAEELGRPYTTVTKYESGEREPGHIYIIEIAKKFGVTTDYILGVSERNEPQYSKKASSDLSDEAFRVAAAYDKASAKERETIRFILSDYMPSSAPLRLAARTGTQLDLAGIEQEDYAKDEHSDIPL